MALTPLTWPYVAGFFDGEGCVHVYQDPRTPQRPRVMLTFAQVERQAAILLALQAFLGAHGVRAAITSHTYKRRPTVTMVQLRISARDGVVVALEALLPHLRVKHEAATKALYILYRYRRAVPAE